MISTKAQIHPGLEEPISLYLRSGEPLARVSCGKLSYLSFAMKNEGVNGFILKTCLVSCEIVTENNPFYSLRFQPKLP